MDWTASVNTPPKPNKTGVVVYDDFPLEDVLDCIDWNPFFQASAGQDIWPRKTDWAVSRVGTWVFMSPSIQEVPGQANLA